MLTIFPGIFPCLHSIHSSITWQGEPATCLIPCWPATPFRHKDNLDYLDYLGILGDFISCIYH
ncbi:hypothetical protein GCM10022394_21980 [Zobellella aerophila]|uniref:Uncharacterized protein n=1 Tax=Zobellella aerophila TaxID=870480 RepID=A0ABP6VVX8_9GAMM